MLKNSTDSMLLIITKLCMHSAIRAYIANSDNYMYAIGVKKILFECRKILLHQDNTSTQHRTNGVTQQSF